MVIQSVSTSSIEVQRNHGNQKLKNGPKKTIKYVKNFNKLKKENEAIKDRIIRDTEKTFSARRR